MTEKPADPSLEQVIDENILEQPFDREYMRELSSQNVEARLYSALQGLIAYKKDPQSPTNSTVSELYEKYKDFSLRSCPYTRSVAWAEIYLYNKGILKDTPYSRKVKKAQNLPEEHLICRRAA